MIVSSFCVCLHHLAIAPFTGVRYATRHLIHSKRLSAITKKSTSKLLGRRNRKLLPQQMMLNHSFKKNYNDYLSVIIMYM
jgi:hypothetical protein